MGGTNCIPFFERREGYKYIIGRFSLYGLINSVLTPIATAAGTPVLTPVPKYC